MPTLQNRTAVITGSTSGIGLAMAEALAAEGAHIVLNGLGDEADNADAIKAVAKAAGKDDAVAFCPANMARPDEIPGLITLAEEKFGKADIVINNAGIQHVAPIEDFPPAKWDAIMAINLSSAFHTIQAALPGMKTRGWGRIINTASAHSLVASPYKAAYVAAKHGIVGLTKVVALEAAEYGVTCNAISPGYVWTPLVEDQLADTAKTRGISEEEVKSEVMLKPQPTKEFVGTEEVGAMAAYLCSEMARSITGANLTIDGGWTAQ
ncbi:MAG: 3-hydroxybutyrate dehydrogenase [Pseudomonadota bacterium]